MHLAYVALGANLDDPVTQVHAAFDALRGLPASRLLRTSSLYRTAPVGVHGQPDFINAVAQLETGLDAEALLDALLQIGIQLLERNLQLAGLLLPLAVEQVQRFDAGAVAELAFLPQRAQARHQHDGVGRGGLGLFEEHFRAG